MFKFTVALFALVAFAAAKPGLVTPLAYTAEVVAAPAVATATSSQFFTRNHNGVAAPVLASSARFIDSNGFAADVVAPVSPVATYAQTSYASEQIHSAAAPLAFSAPLTYTSTVLV
uniref:Cuticle protein n=1 Tax=Megaselia scalaris TaxID=36166 RepID=T1H1T2_MEGSC